MGDIFKNHLAIECHIDNAIYHHSGQKRDINYSVVDRVTQALSASPKMIEQTEVMKSQVRKTMEMEKEPTKNYDIQTQISKEERQI